jgi:hypothetical protein
MPAVNSWIVLAGRIDQVRRAELLGEPELVLGHVHRNHDLGSRNDRPLDDIESNAATADHGGTIARTQTGGVEHSPEPGQDRATNHGRAIQRYLSIDLQDAHLRSDAVFGKRRHRVEVVHDCVAHPVARCAVRHEPGDAVADTDVADRRRAAVAVVAVPAAGAPQHHDVVARRNRRDAGSDPLDHAGALVSKDGWQRRFLPAARDCEVAMADPGRRDPHEHLMGPRIVHGDVLDDEGSAGLV